MQSYASHAASSSLKVLERSAFVLSNTQYKTDTYKDLPEIYLALLKGQSKVI